jgi:hypothetical protein
MKTFIADFTIFLLALALATMVLGAFYGIDGKDCKPQRAITQFSLWKYGCYLTIERADK